MKNLRAVLCKWEITRRESKTMQLIVKDGLSFAPFKIEVHLIAHTAAFQGAFNWRIVLLLRKNLFCVLIEYVI